MAGETPARPSSLTPLNPPLSGGKPKVVLKIDTRFLSGLFFAPLNDPRDPMGKPSIPAMPNAPKTCPLSLHSLSIWCCTLGVVGMMVAPFFHPSMAWGQPVNEIDAQGGLDFDSEDEGDDGPDAFAQDDDLSETGDGGINDPFMGEDADEEDEGDGEGDEEPDPPQTGEAAAEEAPRLPEDSPLRFDPSDVAPDGPPRRRSKETTDGVIGDGAAVLRLQRTDAAIARGDLDEARSLWRDVPGEAAVKFDVYNRIVPGHMKRGEFSKALEVLLLQKGLATDGPDDGGVLGDPALKRAIDNDIRLIVKTRLEETELQTVVKQYALRFPADIALLRLATQYDTQGDYEREGEALRRFVTDFPNHPDSAETRVRASAIQDKIRAFQHRIGVILPLHGTMAPFGQAALDGIRLAVGQFHETHPTVSVGWVVRDVAETEPPFPKWLETYRPVALVGPLLSRDVSQIVPLISKTDLLLITPGATASEVAGLGTSVVRNAFSTRAQCRSIAGRATGEMRLKRFAILYPTHRSGPDWMKCFSEEVAKQGGRSSPQKRTHRAGQISPDRLDGLKKRVFKPPRMNRCRSQSTRSFCRQTRQRPG